MRTKAFLLTLLLLAFSACELRPLYREGETPVEVLVCMDWTQLGGNPNSATIMFYPTSGGSPYVFQTNSVTRKTVQVPSGYYTVLVFNRTVEEFGTMTFSDMNHLGTAKCVLEEKIFSWLGRSKEVGRTVYEPEEIVVGRTDNFHVRAMSERKVYTKADVIESEVQYETDSVMVRSKRMVMTGNIGVRIKGLQNIKSVRSYLTGMAGGAYLASRSATDTLATHVLETWSIVKDESDVTTGYITTSFSCLGLPEQYVEEPEIYNNKLNLQLLLVDEETIMNYSFDVGDRIEQIEEELVVNLAIGIGTDPGDTAIVVPDVKPKGGSQTGFDVNLDDWEDGEDVVVPM